jgi:predicted DNA-binding transcriptional regulator AlpA
MSKEQFVYITARQLRHRYGDVSHMWIERRIADDPDFPKPVYFGPRRHWLLAALETWERVKAAKNGAATAA